MHHTAGIEFSVEMGLNIDDRRFLDILNRCLGFARPLAVDAQIAGDTVESRAHLCAVGLPRQRFFCEPQQRFLRSSPNASRAKLPSVRPRLSRFLATLSA